MRGLDATGSVGSLGERLLRVALDQPRDIAVDLGVQTLTYTELRTRAEEFLDVLLRVPEEDRQVVAVRLGKSAALYEAYFALTLAGSGIVPLDPSWPDERARRALALSGARTVVADDCSPEILDAVHRLVPRTDGWHLSSHGRERSTNPDLGAPAIAYVMLTSGTTGEPKAVPIRRRPFHDYVMRAVSRYRVDPTARLSHTFSLTFDPSMFDIFVAWAGGARLCVPRGREHVTVSAYVGSRGITHWFSVPSVIDIAARMNQLDAEALRTLRYSLFGGEQLTWDRVDRWQGVAPQAAMENLYGPTELLISCSAYEVPDFDEPRPETSNQTVPIGQVYDHLEWRLEGTPTRGELWIRGSQRFTGYLGKGRPPAEPTDWYATGDIVTLEGGSLVHIGRVDDQVKVLGHRVELTEIEHVLRRCPGVVDAAAVLISDPDPHLVAFYTGRQLTPDGTRLHLATSLPTYARPRRVHHLEALPLTVNGKTDRQALRAQCARLS